MKHNLALSALVLTFLLPAVPAHADFGSRGVVVLEPDLDLSLIQAKTTEPDGETESLRGFELGASASYFVTDHISLGGRLAYGRLYPAGESTQTTTFVGVVAGYQLRLNHRLHLWPQVRIGYARQTLITETEAMPKLTKAAVSLYAPVVLEVTDHVLIGFGPLVAADFYSKYERYNRAEEDSKTKLIGTAAMVAGWF
jgi:hypothetical protein